MKVLIAGGLGFIGTNLSIDLLKKGNEIVIVDDLSSGLISNLDIIKQHGKVDFIQQDISEEFYVDGVDRVYNLACEASPQFYQSNPLQTTKTCVIGTVNLLEIAKRNDAKFLQASTSEVYGDPLEHPQKETYLGNVSCTGIRACYDEGKRCAESIVMDYHRMYGIDTKIVRIFNTYGDYMRIDDGRVVSNFIAQGLQNKPMTVYGDGSQTRSVCYVQDLIRGLQDVMECEYHFPINLGNDEEYTVLELAKIVSESLQKPLNVEYFDLPEDDPTRRKPDLSLAREIINWNPQYSVRQGIEKTIKNFESVIK